MISRANTYRVENNARPMSLIFWSGRISSPAWMWSLLIAVPPSYVDFCAFSGGTPVTSPENATPMRAPKARIPPTASIAICLCPMIGSVLMLSARSTPKSMITNKNRITIAPA